MRKLIIVSLCMLFLMPTPSLAWLLQPPEGAEVTEETRSNFREGISSSLAAFEVITRAFREAESNDVPLDLGLLSEARDSLVNASDTFRSLSESELVRVSLDWSSVREASNSALGQEFFLKFDNAATVADELGNISIQIVADLDTLNERTFGPSSSLDVASRAAVSRIASMSGYFVDLANQSTLAMEFGLSQ